MPAQLVDVAIEALEFGEEMGLREAVVDDTDGIIRIEGDEEVAADLLVAFMGRGAM